MTINQLVEQKIERLRKYKERPDASDASIKAQIDEINCIVDHFNSIEKYCIQVENESHQIAKKYLNEVKKSEYYKRLYLFYGDFVEIDGEIMQRYYFDLSDITNKKIEKPYGWN